MNKRIIISMVFNLIIFILVVIASIMMFTGFRFMGDDIVLESTKLGMFRFFTVDSNMFAGIISLIYFIYEIKILKGKIKTIPSNLYILKFMATTAVMLTFITVICYLGPISKGGIISMLKNSNLFFHLIVPVLCLISFTIFEKTDKPKIIYGVIPTLLYEIFYITNLIIHAENGKVSPLYDWYWFAQGGLWQIVIVGPLMIIISYIISLLIGKVYFRKGENNGQKRSN